MQLNIKFLNFRTLSKFTH